MTRRAWLVVGLLLVLGACSPGTRPSPATTSPSPATSAAPSASAAASASATAGRPYSGEDVLAAMRESRRPGGVPDSIETEAIAGSVAEQLWTWSGEPWSSLAIGGACGDETCSLDVSGAPDEVEGTDQYSFTVELASGTVALADANLQGLPASIADQLDDIARAALVGGELDGLELAAAAWLLPAAEDRYRLAYRSGGEEGAPGVDVVVDRATGAVVSVDPVS